MDDLNAKELLRIYYRDGYQELNSCSDEFIISKIIEGNTDLFEIIVQRYNQQLFRITRGYLANRQDAEDAMQSTYMKAFEKLSQFRGHAQFSTWLIRIAINEALKKKKGQSNISDLFPLTNYQNGEQKNKEEVSTPESKVIQNDMNNHLEKAIDALPAKYRSVLIMREIEQLNTRETAEALKITRSNVKVRLHRSKEMVRDELTEMLGDINLLTFKGDDCNRMTKRVMTLIKKRQN